MPVIARRITAATENALQGLKFSNPARPAAISLWYAMNTANETFSFSAGEFPVTQDCIGNVEAAAGVIDTNRDQRLFREPVPAGQYFLSVPTVTTEHLFLLNIELL